MINIWYGFLCNIDNTSVGTYMIYKCEYYKRKARFTMKIETAFPASSLMYNKWQEIGNICFPTAQMFLLI